MREGLSRATYAALVGDDDVVELAWWLATGACGAPTSSPLDFEQLTAKTPPMVTALRAHLTEVSAEDPR